MKLAGRSVAAIAVTSLVGCGSHSHGPRPFVTKTPIDVLGSINLLTASSIEVGTVVCEIDDSSPTVDRFKLGDRVDIGCREGVLTKIVPAPA